MDVRPAYENQLQLIEDIRAGKGDAFKYIYRIHYNTVKSIVKRYSPNADDAKDVMQDTLIALYENIVNDKFKARSSLKTYLFSISRNICYKKYSTKKSEMKISFIENEKEEDEMENRINHIMSSIETHLSEECQKILTYFYFEKKSYAQISADMGYTAAFAKNKKARCMAHLKKSVKELYPNVP